MKIKLDGVAETLLITLNARAKDYENPKSVLHDKKSFEIASQLDYDFKKFDTAWASYYGVLARAYIMDESKSLKYKWEEYKDTRSQDLQAFYHDAGQFYCYNVEQYLRDNGHIKGRVCPIILPEYEVQDIDNDADWKMAEFKYTYLKEGN